MIYPGLLAVFFVFLGVFAFHKLQGEIVDELNVMGYLRVTQHRKGL